MNQPVPDAGSAGRQNQWPGPKEVELRAALDANPVSVAAAKDAWAQGASDLSALSRELHMQKDGLSKFYDGDAGRKAAKVYQEMSDMVDKRQKEMGDVAKALSDSHTAISAARAAYYDLPPVDPPSDGRLPTAPAMGATRDQKADHAKKLDRVKHDNAVADAKHEADKRAAEAAATTALTALDRSLNRAADKMRPVAGMEQPAPMQTETGNRTPGLGMGHGPRRNSPGTLDRNGPGPGTVNPDQLGPDSGRDFDTTPPDIPDNGPELDPDLTPDNIPDRPGPVLDGNDGVLLGPGPQAGITPGSGGSLGLGGSGASGTSSVGTPGTVPIGAGGIPGSASRPIPGSSARTTGGRTPIGRSRITASSGALGRGGLTPGQSATGRPSTGGMRGGAGRGLTPGQSAGRRGAAGARDTSGGRGVPGQSAGRGGRGGKGQREDGYESTYLQDESQWLDDDETSPPTLD